MVVPKNNKKKTSQHECGFCEKTFASLKFLEVHLNICNKQQNNAEQSQNIAPKNIHNGKRKFEDSRKISASKQTNPIGKKEELFQKNILTHNKIPLCLISMILLTFFLNLKIFKKDILAQRSQDVYRLPFVVPD